MSSMRTSAILLLWLVACGEEEEGGGGGGGGAAGGRAGRAATPVAGGTAAAEKLQSFKQIESLAADEKEAKSLRHQFRETDFQFDPSGTVNRDPFRSFVINQPGVSTSMTDNALTAEPTELCPAKRQIASTYMARELKLTGIVSRGTTRTALFSDTAQRGHLVRRNDCIGKEKGRVIEIGATYAKAEISAEPLPNQPPRAPEVIVFQLYPTQLPIGDAIDDVSDGPRSRGRGDDLGGPPSRGGGTRGI